MVPPLFIFSGSATVSITNPSHSFITLSCIFLYLSICRITFGCLRNFIPTLLNNQTKLKVLNLRGKVWHSSTHGENEYGRNDDLIQHSKKALYCCTRVGTPVKANTKRSKQKLHCIDLTTKTRE